MKTQGEAGVYTTRTEAGMSLPHSFWGSRPCHPDLGRPASSPSGDAFPQFQLPLATVPTATGHQNNTPPTRTWKGMCKPNQNNPGNWQPCPGGYGY